MQKMTEWGWECGTKSTFYPKNTHQMSCQRRGIFTSDLATTKYFPNPIRRIKNCQVELTKIETFDRLVSLVEIYF